MTNNPLSVVPSTDTVGHGTFLASIAAGSENEELTGAAPEAEIVVVKLKKARNYYINKYLVPPEQENVYESSAVMVGIDYIIRKAQQLGRPAAICIGLGTNIGGHSGLSLFEEYIETVSNYTGVCLCVAAGNESQAMHHYLGKVPANSSEMVQLKVGENAGDIYINMWNSASERLSVSVRSPTGEVVQRVPARSASRLETMLVLERTTVIIEYQFPFRGRGGQNTIIKLLSATPGVWTFTVYGDITIEGIYHMWLPITGFVSPEVSFFMPDPYYTITIPATSNGPITCGGYNSVGNSLYEKSSWGPTRLPALAPDIVAPALNVTGIYPWGPGVMSGTSVAAAISAGAGALMLQWGIVEGNDIAISTFRIRAYFIIGANRNPGIIYPSLQWGFGSLNLSQAINLI